MKIVSGGQTGVDRAALDVAIDLGIPHGGWCPRGRRAEDGVIPQRFALRETDSRDYAVRTDRNVLYSDGTLIVTRSTPTGGTALTARLARERRKPLLVVDLDSTPQPSDVQAWLAAEEITVLNVAGPRESGTPGIAAAATAFLRSVLETS